jgi:hypothetical protein
VVKKVDFVINPNYTDQIRNYLDHFGSILHDNVFFTASFGKDLFLKNDLENLFDFPEGLT